MIARGGEPAPITLSDRLRPPGVGFGVGWIHVYPPSIPPEQLRLAEEVAVESVRALGLRDAIAFPQLIASPDGSVAVVEVAARIPGGQMADLVRHAVGVDLVEVALRQALGEDVPDDVALPRFTQPLAIRFFTAAAGPASDRRGDEDRRLDAVLASEGVVQADTYLQIGETIRPVRRDGDRRGYVIAVADTPAEALAAPSSPRRGSRSRSPHELQLRLDHYREILEAAKTGGYRFAPFGNGPERGEIYLRHDVDLSLDAALTMAELEAEHGVATTYLLMTESVFYNLASSEGVAAIARLRELGHAVGLHAVHPNVELDERFDPVVSWHNPKARVHVAVDSGGDQRLRGAVLRPADVSLGLEPALALRLPARGASRRRLPVAPDPRPPRDLGVPGRDDGTDDALDAERGEGPPARAAGRRRHRP